MSFNLIAAWPLAIVAVSDRRLTDFVSMAIRTNRSTKMTLFGCADAHGLIVYNGIGLDDEGLTPGDWLVQLAEQKLFDGTFQDVLQGVGADLEARLQKLRARYGPKNARHTFTFGAWHDGVSAIYHVSNYEGFGSERLAKGSESVAQTASLPAPGAEVRIVATGVHPPKADFESVGQAIKTHVLSRVVARCIKVLRDVAYRQGKPQKTAGASAQWAAIGPKREEVWCGLDVVGGQVAQESPNLINIQAEMHVGGTMSVRTGGPGMIIRDAYSGQEKIAQYDPAQNRAVFLEPMCGVCGSPFPASHRYCEVCFHNESHAKGRKQRRKR